MGTPFAYDQGPHAVSATALADPPAWDQARAAVAFDEASRPLVHALKYRDNQEAGLLMARMMVRAGRTLIERADLVVPVPLYRWRLWSRRFNQSAVLSREIGRVTGLPYRPDVLVRQRATRSQVGLDNAQRRKNVRGAFVVPAGTAAAVAGQTILLVDDVRTTGATVDACAEALRRSNAGQILVLSFALVVEPAHNDI
ncbi:MAG: ComF family protein [Alphaproteobacteria bacterium]|nr:ComF family protein [Alphaproteobacteria bacterium]